MYDAQTAFSVHKPSHKLQIALDALTLSLLTLAAALVLIYAQARFGIALDGFEAALG